MVKKKGKQTIRHTFVPLFNRRKALVLEMRVTLLTKHIFILCVHNLAKDLHFFDRLTYGVAVELICGRTYTSILKAIMHNVQCILMPLI